MSRQCPNSIWNQIRAFNWGLSFSQIAYTQVYVNLQKSQTQIKIIEFGFQSEFDITSCF